MTSSSRTDRLLLFIGSLGYLGYVPFASGTVAVAVVGIPLYLLLAWLKLSVAVYVGVVIALTAVAIFVAGHADRVLNEKDSKKNVIDELPGYLIALIGLPATWKVIVAAFFIERAIDIAKVPPANWIEKKLPGGWGVVLDDVVAGIYTFLILQGIILFFPNWVGACPVARIGDNVTSVSYCEEHRGKENRWIVEKRVLDHSSVNGIRKVLNGLSNRWKRSRYTYTYHYTRYYELTLLNDEQYVMIWNFDRLCLGGWFANLTPGERSELQGLGLPPAEEGCPCGDP